MVALQFPCTIFKTQKWMDDYSASDMQCGDLNETQLKAHYHLVDVSTKTNPYTLTKITPFTQPQSMFYGSREEGEKITYQQCALTLFDEFRQLSRLFSLYGPYKYLIEKMITHMQYANGRTFSDMALNSALKEHILQDSSNENSTFLRLKDAMTENIDWENKCYPASKKDKLIEAISFGKLPKFDRFKDNFNGMGITVHDTWATQITIKSLQVDNNRYRAIAYYKVQDHFELDNKDISTFMFNQLRFFRIWFVLQRYNQLGFKPFMTNIDATIEITGERNESK
ncbi:YPO3983 family protein [Pantoea agglomerans]|uniref:YPO3983 family protein n=1 Tax=Enterobacter agglomerans TaxID=549 RepID=UPI0017871771|nr:YPO3983 family protein [Pantoea agglomerans]WVL89366.1 YPO3983 family protein [Pantoea agglomerans]